MGLRTWLLRPLAADTEGDWFVAFKDALEANKSAAGVSVTQENATRLPSVYRCVALNSETVSSLPIDFYKRVGDKRAKQDPPEWYTNPNANLGFADLVAQAQASLDLDGNAFILKASTATGRVVGLYLLAPSAVKVERLTDTGGIIYLVAQPDGMVKPIPSTAMLHVRGFTLPGAIRGMSPIEAAKQAIGLGLAAEQFGAQFFGTGATLSGIISMNSNPGPETVKSLREQFARKHGGISKSHAIGILTGGATWIPLSVKPEESQFLETRRYTDVQIACLYGVPAEYVTEAEGAKGYVTGIYARQYMWLQTGINVRLVRLERAFTSLLSTGSYVKFNRNAFLAMDPTERGNFYAAGLRDRWLAPNEVRSKEDMDPLPGGDDPLWSVQWGPPPTQTVPNPEPAQAGFLMPEGGSHEA